MQIFDSVLCCCSIPWGGLPRQAAQRVPSFSRVLSMNLLRSLAEEWARQVYDEAGSRQRELCDTIMWLIMIPPSIVIPGAQWSQGEWWSQEQKDPRSIAIPGAREYWGSCLVYSELEYLSLKIRVQSRYPTWLLTCLLTWQSTVLTFGNLTERSTLYCSTSRDPHYRPSCTVVASHPCSLSS